MKIIIATGVYPPDIGGPATFAILFEEGLKQREISYYTVPFRSVCTYPKIVRHIAYFCKLFFLIQRGNIVFALDPVSVGFPAFLAAYLRGGRFYLRIGGDYAWEQGMQRFGISDLLDQFLDRYASASRSFPFALRFLVYIERLVAVHAKKILVQSSYLGSVVERWGIPKEKIIVVPNSVELPTLPVLETIRKTLEWGLDQKVIISSGRLVPWKGFHALIDAVDILSHTYSNLLLIIVGDGPQKNALEEHAKQVAIRFTVSFAGTVSKETLMQMLHAADVFVLNTGYEGLSHQILEAFAAQVPVVTTNIPANADIVQDGKTGLVVSYNDTKQLAHAIDRFLSNTSYAMQISNAALGEVRSYTRERTVQETLHALDIEEKKSRVLMISGDSLSLLNTSGVYKRLLLQAQKTDRLTVYVPSAQQGECLLGEQGTVQGFVGNKYTIARQMIRSAQQVKCDVITAQDPFFLGWIAWRIAKRKRVKLQLQVHTNIFELSFRQQSIEHWVKYQVARFLLPRANCIRVVSETLRQHLLAAGIRVPIAVLPIFINKEAIGDASPFSFSSYGFSHTILIASRLEPEKQIEDALYAFPDILKVFPQAGLVIAGDGSQKKQLQDVASRLGLEKQVVFLGNRTDIFSLYKGADCSIATPARFEGYGAAVVEALAAHCPVVSYDVGIAREAGAYIVPKGGIATGVITKLQSGEKGTLRIQLPSAQVWTQEWKRGIEACK